MKSKLVLKQAFFAFAITALFSTTPAFAQSTEAATLSTRLSSLAKSLVNARKEMRQGFAQLQARTGTTTIVGPVIGNNTPGSSYRAIDFYSGRKGSPTIQHNIDGITLALRVYEGSAKVDEVLLKFNFEGRSADQKEADTFVLKSCLDLFLRAADKESTFFVQTNPDPKVGVLCATEN